MRKIFSKIKPDKLLHIVSKREDIGSRQDMCPPEEFLQMASFKLDAGKTFRAHKHIAKKTEHTITQESWIILQGKIRAILYDIDDSILEEVDLFAGDCSITFEGGHNYLCLEDDTLVIETKTGPYLGIGKDKVFLDQD